MPKYLRVTMPDGSEWDVPALAIAGPRARYYAEHDTKTTDGTEFDRVVRDEIAVALKDHEELIDWASNNMNWSDVQTVARQVSPASDVDFQDGWCNGDKRVVEVSPAQRPAEDA